MTVYTEERYPAEFIVSEGQGTSSRGIVTISSAAGAMEPGTVLGKITVGAVTSAAAAGNTGDGVMGAVTTAAGIKAGVYVLTVIEPAAGAGAFMVEGPDGVTIGTGNVAAAFAAGGLSFTLADGATDFVAGDSFTITVAAGTGQYVAYDAAAADGSQVAAGVLFAAVADSAADQQAIAILRRAEVAESALTGCDAAAKVQLAALGIFVR